ncbi:MAG: hypothetical protein ACRDHY_18710 [Anaerolineales bacterium]
MATKAEKARAALEKWERTTAVASEAFHREFDPEHDLVIHGRDKTALVVGHPQTGLFWLVPYVLLPEGQVACGAIDQWLRVKPTFVPKAKGSAAASAQPDPEPQGKDLDDPYQPGRKTAAPRRAEPLPEGFDPYGTVTGRRKR